MRPIFFGPSAQPLYGVFDAPMARPRKTGVLLLYPGLQEYSRAHWAMRALASALVAQGFCTLRFDYRGTGDSAGGPRETTLEASIEDACVAAGELRDHGDCVHVAILGMRLGAAVAMHAADALSYVRRVFLWNPVVDGHAYVRELEAMDAAMRLRLLHPLRPPEGELAGFAFPPGVRRSLEALDLCAPGAPVGRNVELFAEVGAVECRTLEASLARRGQTVTLHTIKDSGGPAPFPDAALLAQDAVATLAARMAEVER